MQDVSLIGICVVAFASVFGLLVFLAGVMMTITRVFPVRVSQIDAAVFAAISATVSTLVPGARVTRIEEKKR